MRQTLILSIRTLAAVLGASGAILSISARRAGEQVPNRDMGKLRNVAITLAKSSPPAKRPGAPAHAGRKRPDAASKHLERRLAPRQLVGLRYKRKLRGKRSALFSPATAREAAAKGLHVGTATVLTTSAIGGCTEPAQNCQATDNFNALGSSRGLVVTADDFVPQGTTVTGLCWWGAYGCDANSTFTDCKAEVTDDFQVRYFTDNAGVPGVLLATFNQGTTLTVSRPVLTGATVADALPEYAFTATHDPLLLEAGVRHWVEITNAPGTCNAGANTCEWFWEISGQGNGRSMQDGDDTSPPNGYAPEDEIAEDLAFCLTVPLTESTRPPNDPCSGAEVIAGEGRFNFDNRTATTDGFTPSECFPSFGTQIENDLWYRWTSPCTDTVLVRSCGLTSVDTIIAVYDGTAACPPTDAALLSCNDDLCGDLGDPRQSMARFDAVTGQDFLIRIGRFPGPPRGVGAFEITCGPPSHTACAAGAGDCCGAGGNATPGCVDTPPSEPCCETVCACDPFCCDVFWDAGCAADGFDASGCGAQALCASCTDCGAPLAGDCCIANGSPNCDDQTCCDAVVACDPQCGVEWDANCAVNNTRPGFAGCDAVTLCPTVCMGCMDFDATACTTSTVDCCAGNTTAELVPGCGNAACCNAVCCEDPYCCDVNWDADCAGTGSGDSGFGAAVLCTDAALGGCPSACMPGPIRLTDRPNGIVDARQPHPPDDPTLRQGIQVLVVSAPPGADNPRGPGSADCWTLCETVVEGGVPNGVDSVVDNGDGTFTITLSRIVSLDAVTKLTYTAWDNTTSTGRIVAHPSNVTGDGMADAADVAALMSCIDGSASCETWECDIDFSGRCTPADLLRLIDVLSGPDYEMWLDTPLPADGICP